MLGTVALAGWFDFLIAPLVVWAVVSMVRSVIKTYDRWKKGRDDDVSDVKSISLFLFGHDANERMRTPAQEGWTDKVDRRLKDIDEGNLETIKLVKKVIANQETEDK